MKKLFQSFLGMTLLLICNSVFSATTTIIGTDIKGLHQTDGKGEYDQIINKTLVSKGLATLKILPPARAESEFIACANCCWSPANLNKEFYNFNFEPKVTEPMGVAKIYIFTAPGKPVLDNLESLKGLKVGIVHGKRANLALPISESQRVPAGLSRA